MLTAHQCETVAYALNGEIICRDCAIKSTSTISVDKADEGFTTAYDLSAWIRFTLDEYLSEEASEWADQDFDYTEDPEGWQAAFDAAPDYIECGSCGTEIS